MKIKSKKVRESARNEDCTLRLFNVCNFNTETTVLAHIGKASGTAAKCGDNMAVYACSDCHDVIDGRSHYNAKYNPDINGDLLRALQETQQKLIDKGLMVIK